MAVASWMLRNRNIRSTRYNRSRSENEEDVVKLDLKKDPQENLKEVLTEICRVGTITETKRINYLNWLLKLLLHIENGHFQIAFSTEDILYCLRITLMSDSTLVRCAGIKAIRHVLKCQDDVVSFNKLHFPFLLARSLDLAVKNEVERIQTLGLIRKVLFLSASTFDISIARCLIALVNCGVEEKDRMLRACLACLSEIGVLNSELFIISGGVASITRNLLECQTPRIAEALCGVLLQLLDRPFTRNHAAIDLHCIAAPYCDFHYRHGWMDKNRDERELRFNCSRLALLSVLRSWPGILYFCGPSNTLGLKAIVDILYLNQLEVRKAVLDLLYELLGLPQPEWTDELSVALSAIDPAEPQAAWRLNDGFVAAEGRSVLPHLARNTPSVTDIHMALLLYCFLETGLLGALSEVIATSDTFISVRATVLLGELLRLIQILLPPECCNVTPALPNLLGYATNKPQALGAVTALQQLHKLLKRRPASSSLYLDYILQYGSFMKRSRNTEHKKCKLSHTRSRLQQLVLWDVEDIIRDTGVLASKDAFTWNWNIIKIILKGECDFMIDLSESSHLNFVRRLVDFYMPSKNRYSHMDLTSFKNTQGYTTVGIELIYCLVRLKDQMSTNLLVELFLDISNHISAITTGKSAHDCLFSPQHMSNTQCQSYFLFIGRLGSSKAGVELLNNVRMFSQLQQLATTTKHDCYVKLIISSLDYSEAGPGRDLLAAVLKCSNEGSRLYATQFLQVLLRAGLPQFFSWGMKLLIGQLDDTSRTVYLTALATLHEACEVSNCLEQLVKLNPNLLHLGEKGVLLLIRFLSIPSGYNLLKKNDFVVHEIKRWDEFLNYRYVRIVENETSDTLTLHQRGEDGRYDKRLSSLKVITRKDLFLPPHIYGQLAKHTEGFNALVEHGSIDKQLHFVENALCETDNDIMHLKAALWTLGHLGASIKGVELLNSKGVLTSMVQLAQHCVVYSVRATAFFALSLIATTKSGADCLFKLGWVCTRHDRHNRWPIIEEENWMEETTDEQYYNVPLSSDSEYTSSDHAFTAEIFPNIPDAESSTTDEEFFGALENTESLTSQQKSSTLPCNQNLVSSQHKRSLSESKTFDVIKTNNSKKPSGEKVEFKLGGDSIGRYRDNSITESTTSGVSSCESVLGKTTQSEKINTLSPIPSSSSLSTLKISGVRARRHSESSRRISGQSTTPSDRSTISPANSLTGKLSHQDLMGYSILRSLRSSRLNESLYVEDEFSQIFTPESLLGNSANKNESFNIDNQNQMGFGDFLSKNFRKTYLDSLSLTSISSVQKFSIVKDDQHKGQCYMGICLPRVLADFFPDQIVSRRLSLNDQSSCLLLRRNEVRDRSDDEKNTTKNRFARHDRWNCFKCSKAASGESESINNHPAVLSSESIYLERFLNYFDEHKCEVLEQVERLGNPVWIKPARQALLHLRQQHPLVFKDICLYSEVCSMLAENTYRLGPRRLLQELFIEVNYESLYSHLDPILTQEKAETPNSNHKTNCVHTSNNSSDEWASHLALMTEQRKVELSATPPQKTTIVFPSSGKRVVYGFNINKNSSGSEGENVSPVRVEPRSPPLSSVKEENLTSTENLISESSASSKRNTIGGEIPVEVPSNKVVAPVPKTLDSLNLTYSQNKFPIRNRSKSDPKSVIK